MEKAFSQRLHLTALLVIANVMIGGHVGGGLRSANLVILVLGLCLVIVANIYVFNQKVLPHDIHTPSPSPHRLMWSVSVLIIVGVLLMMGGVDTLFSLAILALVSQICVGYDERWIAYGCMHILYGIIIALLIEGQMIAEQLSILLYYGLIVITIAGLLPEHPWKIHRHMDHITQKFSPKILKNAHESYLHDIMQSNTVFYGWIVIMVLTVLFLGSYWFSLKPWHSGYRTWIVLSLSGIIYYIFYGYKTTK